MIRSEFFLFGVWKMEYIDNLPPMDLMRSEKMAFVQLIIPVESAHPAITYLGQLGLLQFRDVQIYPFLHVYHRICFFMRSLFAQ